MRIHSLTFIATGGHLILLLLTGCSTPQTRDGVSRAIVHGAESWEGGFAALGRKVSILQVDGKETKNFFRSSAPHVRVTPGRHTMRVGYYANADRPASRGFGDGFFGGQSPMLLLSARDFTFEAEASTSYLLRFDTAAWDAQNIPIWLQEELTDRVIGSSQTLTRLYGTAFIDPLLPTGFKRGVFVVAVDSEPVKPNLMGPAVPIFLTPGPHTIDVIDVSTGWEPPKSKTGQLVDVFTRIPGIDLLAYSWRAARKGNYRQHHLDISAQDGEEYLVRFDTMTWDAAHRSVWLEKINTGMKRSQSGTLQP